MRWTSSDIESEAPVRVRSGFLWLPKRIDDETRWLENATWLEMIDREDDDIHGPGPEWWAVEWLDDRFEITEAGKAYLEGKK